MAGKTKVPDITKDEFISYLEQMTIRELAAKIGKKSTSPLYVLAQQYGIKIQKYTDKRFRIMYKQGFRIIDIAETTGFSQQYVSARIKKMKLTQSIQEDQLSRDEVIMMQWVERDSPDIDFHRGGYRI